VPHLQLHASASITSLSSSSTQLKARAPASVYQLIRRSETPFFPPSSRQRTKESQRMRLGNVIVGLNFSGFGAQLRNWEGLGAARLGQILASLGGSPASAWHVTAGPGIIVLAQTFRTKMDLVNFAMDHGQVAVTDIATAANAPRRGLRFCWRSV